MCSMKWEMPLTCGVSSREPVSSGADVLHLLGDDGEAVGQHLTTNIADFFYHDLVLIADPALKVLYYSYTSGRARWGVQQ